MKLIGLIDEDFINYSKPAMALLFPYCSFKCGKEICQNYSLGEQKIIECNPESIALRYISNPITNSIVMSGLEPFDSWDDLLDVIEILREYTMDDIVIYSGYTEEELKEEIGILKEFNNIIIKFGRYIPNEQSHLDEIIGVELASLNQYAKKIS